MQNSLSERRAGRYRTDSRTGYESASCTNPAKYASGVALSLLNMPPMRKGFEEGRCTQAQRPVFWEGLEVLAWQAGFEFLPVSVSLRQTRPVLVNTYASKNLAKLFCDIRDRS